MLLEKWGGINRQSRLQNNKNEPSNMSKLPSKNSTQYWLLDKKKYEQIKWNYWEIIIDGGTTDNKNHWMHCPCSREIDCIASSFYTITQKPFGEWTVILDSYSTSSFWKSISVKNFTRYNSYFFLKSTLKYIFFENDFP